MTLRCFCSNGSKLLVYIPSSLEIAIIIFFLMYFCFDIFRFKIVSLGCFDTEKNMELENKLLTVWSFVVSKILDRVTGEYMYWADWKVHTVSMS